jgi:hypothetical protein
VRARQERAHLLAADRRAGVVGAVGRAPGDARLGDLVDERLERRGVVVGEAVLARRQRLAGQVLRRQRQELRHLAAVDRAGRLVPAVGRTGHDPHLGELVDAELVRGAVVVAERVGGLSREHPAARLDRAGDEVAMAARLTPSAAPYAPSPLPCAIRHQTTQSTAAS